LAFYAAEYWKATPRFVEFEFSEIEEIARRDYEFRLEEGLVVREWLTVKVRWEVFLKFHFDVLGCYERRPMDKKYLVYNRSFRYEGPGKISITWDRASEERVREFVAALEGRRLNSSAPHFPVHNVVETTRIDTRGFREMREDAQQQVAKELYRNLFPIRLAVLAMKARVMDKVLVWTRGRKSAANKFP
jgi:hypothetical protein